MSDAITTLLVTLMLGIIANVIYDYIKNYSNHRKGYIPFKKSKTQETPPSWVFFLVRKLHQNHHFSLKNPL